MEVESTVGLIYDRNILNDIKNWPDISNALVGKLVFDVIVTYTINLLKQLSWMYDTRQEEFVTKYMDV